MQPCALPQVEMEPLFNAQNVANSSMPKKVVSLTLAEATSDLSSFFCFS